MLLVFLPVFKSYPLAFIAVCVDELLIGLDFLLGLLPATDFVLLATFPLLFSENLEISYVSLVFVPFLDFEVRPALRVCLPELSK